MNYCLSSTAVGPNRWGNGTYRERMLLTVTACGHRPPRASFTRPFPERHRYCTDRTQVRAGRRKERCSALQGPGPRSPG